MTVGPSRCHDFRLSGFYPGDPRKADVAEDSAPIQKVTARNTWHLDRLASFLSLTLQA